MRSIKPTLPKGTRDFNPLVMAKRNHIVSVIEGAFELNGFQQIETPAMENLTTLTGKYGNEGDQLLFKVLNSGDFLLKADRGSLEDEDSARFGRSITEKGLHYDLTVPLARFVVMNRNDIHFPFKRYQIQPVWRADRPQKGRYREFYQCDADIIGSDSLVNEIELLRLFDSIFRDLSLDVEIQINNRKILEGLAIHYEVGGRFTELTIILDKLDKVGIKGVCEELERNDFPTQMIEMFSKDVASGTLEGNKALDIIEEWFNFANIQVGQKGVQEVRELMSAAASDKVKLKLLLARGLDYYTGCIFEIKSMETEFGSLGSGGRYDDLTSLFGLDGVSGVGISFGLDRIYDVMTELDRFPETVDDNADILLVGFDDQCILKSLDYADTIRKAGIKCEVYPDKVKFKKSMKYSDQRGFKYVGIIGEEELKLDVIALKDMSTGDQEELAVSKVIDRLKG
ncbi:MAG: histidine--tRNA ligase [Chitinophagales bacterium]|nr:histidine--tRNA ligase [Chitinophagales bacterium]